MKAQVKPHNAISDIVWLILSLNFNFKLFDSKIPPPSLPCNQVFFSIGSLIIKISEFDVNLICIFLAISIETRPSLISNFFPTWRQFKSCGNDDVIDRNDGVKIPLLIYQLQNWYLDEISKFLTIYYKSRITLKFIGITNENYRYSKICLLWMKKLVLTKITGRVTWIVYISKLVRLAMSSLLLKDISSRFSMFTIEFIWSYLEIQSSIF